MFSCAGCWPSHARGLWLLLPVTALTDSGEFGRRRGKNEWFIELWFRVAGAWGRS